MPSVGRLVRQFLFRSDSAGLAVPPMDGPLTPNELLSSATEAACLESPRDMALLAGSLYVAAGSSVWKTELDGAAPHRVINFDDEVGALTSDGSTLFAAVVGLGVVAIDVAGGTSQTVASLPARCPTALAVRGSTLVLAEGSAHHGIDDWAVDLMQKGSSGSITVIDVTTRDVRSLLRGIRYCAGVAVSRNGDEVVYSEAWAHRLMAVSLTGRGSRRAVTGDMPAYPGRISVSPTEGYWLSAFAVRTYLVEFVLTQDEYRAEMLRSIPQQYWIRPHLRPSQSGLDPLQGGQLKKLGVTKPWAPARSYGLVVRLNSDFQPVESYHSRADGRTHGVVQALEHDGHILVAAAGADCVVKTRIAPLAELTAVEW